jgi:hypothetical protein
MPLLDALLLDPYRMNVWVAARTDGVPGTGTHSDPYDGSTSIKFDALMNQIAALAKATPPTYTCVHVAPGTFQTYGYADAVGGSWQAKKGMAL